MNKLLEKIKKSSTIKDTAILDKSKIYNEKDLIDTGVPAMNIALSANIDGGLPPGLLILAGPSKHFKSAFSLMMAKAYMEKYDDAVVLFYDSEFGTPISYFDTFKLDRSRIVHTPVTDIEQLKHDLMTQLSNINRGEHVIVLIDSIGNLASKKEVDDAIEGKTVADMTRAKAFKSLFRMITPHLTLKNIPLIAIAHVYKEMGMFPKDIVSGGTGVMLSADNVWILGRQQEKDKDKKIKGYNFIINVEKSRYVKEKSKIPISVTYEGGVNKWSGLFEIGVAGGYITKVGPNKFRVIDSSTGEIKDDQDYTEEELDNNDEFWTEILEKTDFKEYVYSVYALDGSGPSTTEEEKE